MDKRAVLNKFVDQIMADLAVLTQSAMAAHDAATHSESKAEDQYDTRGLEASYLAGAQSKRVLELEVLANLYRHADIINFTASSAIAATAVIQLESENKTFYYLLMPKGGGMHISFEDKTIQVVTPQSPMGNVLLGRRVGEEVQVEIQKAFRDYDIINVW